MSHYPWHERVVTAENFPDTIPTSCFRHRRYDCPECSPRVWIERASDEDKERAGLRASGGDCSLTNPRLSEVEWDEVAGALRAATEPET